MPVNPTYPGVYIEELPSGVHTITGVPTSITAFIGRANRGPANIAFIINSFADFQRTFGGLDVDYPISYAVRDFYINGGSQAIIVRLFSGSVTDSGAKIDLGHGLLLVAHPGMWGDKLRAVVDTNHITQAVADRFGLQAADLFNLTIQYDPANNGPKEIFLNLSVVEGPRRIDRVLAQESQFVMLPNLPAQPQVPAPATVNATGGADGALLQDGDYLGGSADKPGYQAALDRADIFNLLCIPADTRDGDISPTVYEDAMSYCHKRRAFLIVDAPMEWAASPTFLSNAAPLIGNFVTADANYAALYFPRVIQADPLRGGQTDTFVPCGMIAGIMARTDNDRGVWKAPAGINASLNGVVGLQINLTDNENGILNPLGINCLRRFPVTGTVVWGSRTLRGANQLTDDYKYVPVRRTALYIEESLYRGLQWVVFEPNDEPLWAQIRLNVGAFMHDLFRKGAFQGQTPTNAYLVKCDSETTTQNDINNGIVNIFVGFAPLKPAEFVIVQIQQLAGQIQV